MQQYGENFMIEVKLKTSINFFRKEIMYANINSFPHETVAGLTGDRTDTDDGFTIPITLSSPSRTTSSSNAATDGCRRSWSDSEVDRAEDGCQPKG
jgi:hypothetical protein